MMKSKKKTRYDYSMVYRNNLYGLYKELVDDLEILTITVYNGRFNLGFRTDGVKKIDLRNIKPQNHDWDKLIIQFDSLITQLIRERNLFEQRIKVLISPPHLSQQQKVTITRKK